MVTKMIPGNFWHQLRSWIIIDFFRTNSSDLEWFECQYQKFMSGIFFPLKFYHRIQILNQNWKKVNKHVILKFTLLLFKSEHKVFLNLMILTKSHNWPQIPTQWWKLSGKNAPWVNFWSWHSNHSKSDEFAQKNQ